ncbi:hypothetical protein [Streptomyces sp. NPDC046727]|uniref:hypothetical protein n=1 Tax=Streptomyces sp. NPDC046727 TaxID=3155373 RepID=UPI0033E2D756
MTDEEFRRFLIEDMCRLEEETGCWVWDGSLGRSGYPTWFAGRRGAINVRQWLWGPFEENKPEPIKAIEGGTLEAYPIYFNTRECQNWRRCVNRDHMRIQRWNRRHVV